MTQHKKPEIRKNELLQAATVVAARTGIPNVTRLAVAKEAGVAEATVSFHFNTMHQLRKALARRAVLEEDVPLLVPLLLEAQYRKLLTGKLRERAIQHLATQG